MSRLTKFLFGLTTDPQNSLFGLVNGQIRLNGAINSAGWFNEKGEKLGYGDISYADLERIAKEINNDEIFFIISEADTMWNVPSELDKSAPGKDYVIPKSQYVIYGPTKAILRPENDMFEKQMKKVKRSGTEMIKMSCSDLYNILGFVKSKKTSPQQTMVVPVKEAVPNPLFQKPQIIAAQSTKPTGIGSLGILSSSGTVKKKVKKVKK